jgi:hypothetical protein
MPLHRRPAGAVVFFLVAMVTLACATPPDKEINQAQGAIEAARSAGAEQYASEEFSAAEAAMRRSSEFVQQRDYRQALNQALDARERAKEAARRAAEQRAAARSAAELGLADLSTAVQQARGVINAAQAARVPAKDIAVVQNLATRAENAMQEARAALSRDDYQAAVASIKGRADALRPVTESLSESAAGRRRRR